MHDFRRARVVAGTVESLKPRGGNRGMQAAEHGQSHEVSVVGSGARSSGYGSGMRRSACVGRARYVVFDIPAEHSHHMAWIEKHEGEGIHGSQPPAWYQQPTLSPQRDRPIAPRPEYAPGTGPQDFRGNAIGGGPLVGVGVAACAANPLCVIAVGVGIAATGVFLYQTGALDAQAAAAEALAKRLAEPPPAPAPPLMMKRSEDAKAAGGIENLSTKQLKKAGVDAEAAKKGLGVDKPGRFNIGVDKTTGEVVLTPVKRGAGPNVPTGQTLDELARDFPIGR